jgi:5'-nucleotidase
MLGIPSIALSLATAETGPVHYESAAAFGVKLAGVILERGLPQDTLLNVNVPNCNAAEINGIFFTRRGRRLYEGAIKETFDPWGRKHYWIGGGTPSWDLGEDTDSSAIAANKISITPMHLDPTNHEALELLKNNWTDLNK